MTSRNWPSRPAQDPPPPLPFFWRWGLLLLISVVGIGWLGGDGWALERLWVTSPGVLRETASAISRWMDWPWVLGGLAIATLIAHVRGAAAHRRWFLSMLIAGTLVGATATLIRSVTGRTRPSASSSVAQGWYGPRSGGRWLVGVRDYNAFPSGHTATVAGVAALLLIRRHRTAPLAVIATLAVGWSRIAMGAHRLSDVTAAMVLSGLLAPQALRILARLETLASKSLESPLQAAPDFPDVFAEGMGLAHRVGPSRPSLRASVVLSPRAD